MDDTPPPPSETPGDPDLIDDDALPAFDTRAFVWAFGACLAAPFIGVLLQSLLMLVLVPIVWIGTLVVGIGSLVSGRRAYGSAITLGALGGALVGFTLCSGLLGSF